jgi:hypothetical protein
MQHEQQHVDRAGRFQIAGNPVAQPLVSCFGGTPGGFGISRNTFDHGVSIGFRSIAEDFWNDSEHRV